MAGSSASTLFVNQTGGVVKMKVGNSHSSSPIASISAGGGQFRMNVNMNDTYREFVVGVGSDDVAKTVTVTSDDCCDFQCITIKENLADGTIALLREPRQQTSGPVKLADHLAPAAEKPWFTWKMWA